MGPVPVGTEQAVPGDRGSAHGSVALVERWSVAQGNTSDLPEPWWAGPSRWAALASCTPQPEGPFWHVSPTRFAVGTVLTSPAQRQALPRFSCAAESLRSRQVPFSFDEHAVYVMALPRPRAIGEIATCWAYEVVPQGLLWPDPEAPFGESWCCASAVVVRVLAPEG